MRVMPGAVWPTIQGEGILVGTPTVFLRLHGCDYACSFCDTKDSWRAGSEFVERSAADVGDEINRYPQRWVSITGGNPVLQADELCEMMDRLKGKKCLVETQASLYHEGLFARVQLFSLSPKLHDWRWEPLESILLAAAWSPSAEVQIKVVVSTPEEAEDVILRYGRIYDFWRAQDSDSPAPHFILLPEFGAGRGGVKAAIEAVQAAQGKVPFNLRVIPQVHKLALYVP